ncbi:MAG: response regulator transcription factor [Flavobacteriales bacterium]|nr:response regulator transcription factor [Flavobacteriales bacterium]
MKNLSCIVVDDEQDAAGNLVKILRTYCPEMHILEVLNDPHLAEERINALRPKVLFLDIEMPGKTGLEIARKFQDMNYYIVFHTGFSKHAINAIKHNAFDFLLKPTTAEDLLKTMARIKRSIRQAQDLAAETKTNAIVVKSGIHYRQVPVNEILMVEAEGSYSNLVLKSGERILVSRNLKSVMTSLEGHQFVRVHNSRIVNANEVALWKLAENACVLTNGEEFRISVRRKDEVRDFLIIP